MESELTRYLTIPGQAIGYKLGERAWLLGRERARERHGDAFDLKAWHMAALSRFAGPWTTWWTSCPGSDRPASAPEPPSS